MITVESYAESPWVTVDDRDVRQGIADRLKQSIGNVIERVVVALKRLFAFLLRLCAWSALFGVVAAGWWWRDELKLSAESGLGYALGVVSASCMVVLLIYPLRKRIRWLGFLGPAKNWFLVHMCLGVSAPIAALYHCGFQLGSLNSQIALTCALVVSGSGLVGRFLYRRIYSDWSGKRSVVKKFAKPKLFSARELRFLELVGQRLSLIDQQTQSHRRSWWSAWRWSMRIKSQLRTERLILMRFCRKQVYKAARNNRVLYRERDRLLQIVERYIVFRSLQSQQIARVQIYERLFALWHVAHLPFFFLLLVSVVVHVFAVHLY